MYIVEQCEPAGLSLEALEKIPPNWRTVRSFNQDERDDAYRCAIQFRDSHLKVAVRVRNHARQHTWIRGGGDRWLMHGQMELATSVTEASWIRDGFHDKKKRGHKPKSV